MSAAIAIVRAPRRRALVIDDDSILARITRAMLSRLGFDATCETDPRVAVERVRSGECFDLVVCDFQMPVLDGGRVIAAIREHHANGGMPEIVLTTGDEIECAGATAVLPKPYTLAQLRQLVGVLFDQ